MSVGGKTDMTTLGTIPENFTVKASVDQIAVLQSADVFITHCGMNSVNESLYFGVPMVLFPQHSEQRTVANRVAELGAGIMLKGKREKDLAAAAAKVLANPAYKENAQKLSESFRKAGGAGRAADFIRAIIERKS
jgi:MGT family glycosyltransferase